MIAELLASTVAEMTEYFPSQASIQAKAVVQDPTTGQEQEAWADVLGMRLIPAAKAPMSALELQAAGYTATDQVWQVLLQGAYPQITTRHRVTVDETATGGVVGTYDIDAVETDQTNSLTRLRVRQVTT